MEIKKEYTTNDLAALYCVIVFLVFAIGIVYMQNYQLSSRVNKLEKKVSDITQRIGTFEDQTEEIKALSGTIIEFATRITPATSWINEELTEEKMSLNDQ